MPSANEELDIVKLWEDLKDKKPIRKGVFIGEQDEKFYVAKSEEEIYELSALVYYVWLISDGEHTVEDLANRMSKEIQVELNEVKEPLIIALNSLYDVQLIDYT
ncbi:MAG: PqqD family protein [Desulfurococcales archaeon ex4484_58]|nr:MAG: PqqD family protein [Desulfurococcales archaeon ex4484_58]